MKNIVPLTILNCTCLYYNILLKYQIRKQKMKNDLERAEVRRIIWFDLADYIYNIKFLAATSSSFRIIVL